jgi:enoyl-CoA hydratase/carnithine racemase
LGGSDTRAHARDIARNMARIKPDAIRAAKRLLNRGTEADAALGGLLPEEMPARRFLGESGHFKTALRDSRLALLGPQPLADR